VTENQAENGESGRFRCGELSEDNDRCDLQPDHGGSMHSGLLGWPYRKRIWWNKDDRKVVPFGGTGPPRGDYEAGRLLAAWLVVLLCAAVYLIPRLL